MSTQKRRYELKARAESRRQTRERIVEATVALHQEVGPARTTVAEIARRAGVQRLTVYNHFPEEAELFAACQKHFLAKHPPPDFTEPLALDDPAARVRAVLGVLYRSHAGRQRMTAKVLRDRSLVPDLDALLQRTVDANQRRLADVLTSGFGVGGARARRLRAVIALGLDFWTWQRLTGEGLTDAAAADLVADLVATAAGES